MGLMLLFLFDQAPDTDTGVLSKHRWFLEFRGFRVSAANTERKVTELDNYQ